jgi:hypothetical protein
VRFDDEVSVDYIGPIVAKLDEGDFDAARALLAEAPPALRETIRWTVAEMKSIVL